MLMLTPILLPILRLIIYYDAGEFPLCSGEKDCSSQSRGSEENWLWCPSGTKTYRDGFNNCEFKQCDDPRCELEDYKQCPSPNLNVYVAHDPKAGNSGCQDYLPCPGSGTPGVNCPQDIKTSSSFGLRDSWANWQWRGTLTGGHLRDLMVIEQRPRTTGMTSLRSWRS